MNERDRAGELIAQGLMAALQGDKAGMRAVSDAMLELLPPEKQESTKLLRRFRRKNEMPSMTEYRISMLLSMLPDDCPEYAIWQRVFDLNHILVHTMEGRCTLDPNQE